MKTEETGAEIFGGLISALALFALYCCGIGWMIHGFFSRDIHELCIGGFVTLLIAVNTSYLEIKKRLRKKD